MATDTPNGLAARVSILEENRIKPTNLLLVLIGLAGFVLALTGGIGALFSQPFNSRLTRLEVEQTAPGVIAAMQAEIDSLRAGTVPRVEIEKVHSNLSETQQRIMGFASENRLMIVTREELNERFHTIENELADLQRQSDQIKSEFGGTYNLRDQVSKMQNDIDLLRQRLYDAALNGEKPSS